MTFSQVPTQPLQIKQTKGTNPSCEGQEITLTTTPTTFNGIWTEGPNCYNPIIGFGSSITFTPTKSVTYGHFDSFSSSYCQYKLKAGGLTITILPSVGAAGLITGAINVCKGENNITYTVPSIPNATSYSWTLPSGASGTSTTNSITVNYGNNAISGKITVKGNNQCGFGAISSLSVTVNSLPTVAATTSKTSICPGENITLTGSGASTYVWDNNVTNGVSFAPADTKIYTVTGTDANGCKNTANVLVTVNSLPTVIATASKTTVCTGDNVTLTGSGASTYTWDNNVSNGVSLVPTTTKTYTVTGTDANGCKNTANVLVTVNTLPTVTANSNKSVVCSGDDVTLTGSGASTYSWDNNVTNGVSFAVNATKTYTVTGTDANGCKNTASVSVSVNSLPTIAANATKTSICPGDNVTLTGTGASTYSWDNNVSNGVSFIPNATKTYTVIGTDANGCMNTASVLVTVNSLPTVVANASKTTVCTGDNVTLTGIGASTYTWDNNVSNEVSFIPTTTKTYTVTGMDVNGCKNTANVLVTVNTLPTVTANSNKSVVCSGDDVTLTGSGASTYVWNDNVINAVSFIINATKTYTVTGTDANGCKNTASVSVTVNSLPTIVATSTKTAVCSGENVTLTASGTQNIVWDNNITNAVSFVPSVTKTYIATATDANGCKNTANVLVTVNALPTIIAIATKTAVCTGDNVTLTGTGASTYTWDHNVMNGVSFVPSATKTYSVTGTDVNGCKNTANVIITVNTLPTVTANSNKSVVCSGDNVTLTGSGASTYVWDNNVSNGVSFAINATKTYSVTGIDANGCKNTANVFVTVNALPTVVATASKTAVCMGDNITLTGTGASTYTWDNNVTNGVAFVPTTTKTYIVTGTDANGCKNTANVLVTVNTLPTVTANSNKTVVCSGDNVTLTGSGALIYTWDNNVTNGVSFVPTTTKTYTVTGTDANGCKNTANVIVTVNTLPTVKANSNKSVVCSGDNVTLTGSGASTYTWDNNVTNGVSFVPTTTKTYIVTGMDANGCKNTSSVSVSVNSLPIIVATASKTAVCLGENVTLTGSGASTYAWDNNVSNGVSFVPSTTNTYSVTGTDVNGCKNTANVLVTVNSFPTVTANSNKSVVCSGESVTLTGNGASSYAWDNNVSNGVSFMPSVTKTYTVTGTDENGCKNTANVLVTVNSLPTVIAIASKTAICIGENVTLTGSGASTYAWDNNVSNGVSFVPSATKTYIVTGTDANGCVKTATVNVTVNALPTIVATASKTAVCTGESVTLTGSGASTYLWDNNVSDGVAFVPSATKTYSVTGTDVNGCKNSVTVIVSVNNLPAVSIAASGNTTICKDNGLELSTKTEGSSYLWSNGEITSNIYPNQTGVYFLKLKDANGCEGISNSIKVIVNQLPTATISLNGPTTYCSNKLTELVSSNGVSYLWNDGTTSKTIKPNQSGSYFVKVTDMNGCSASSEPVYLTVNDCASIDQLSLQSVQLFPNPTTDLLSVEVSEDLMQLAYKIMDVSGKELVTGKLNHTLNTIDVEDLASGTYFFEIENGYKTKFIKQ